MKLTAQEEYGLRCLWQLAREPSGSITIPEIAQAESLTPAYVAKLMGILRRLDLVKSTRGQKGGYELARAADQIPLSEVLFGLGGHLYSLDFCRRHAGDRGECVHNSDCSVRALFAALEQGVVQALAGLTLQDLVRSERSMRSWVQLGAHGTPASVIPGLVGES
jgi:Rrf2 family protein